VKFTDVGPVIVTVAEVDASHRMRMLPPLREPVLTLCP